MPTIEVALALFLFHLIVWPGFVDYSDRNPRPHDAGDAATVLSEETGTGSTACRVHAGG